MTTDLLPYAQLDRTYEPNRSINWILPDGTHHYVRRSEETDVYARHSTRSRHDHNSTLSRCDCVASECGDLAIDKCRKLTKRRPTLITLRDCKMRFAN